MTTVAGEPVGTVERVDDDGVLLDPAGVVLCRLTGLPDERARDPACPYPLADDAGAGLGTLTLLTTAAVRQDLTEEFVQSAVFWDKPAALKVPTLGARVDLDHPVGSAVGDLLLSTCVTMALGPQAFIRR